MFERNVNLGKAVKIGAWRKTSLGTYKMTADCQVYCLQQMNVEKALEFIASSNGAFTMTHLVGKACGKMFEKYPQVNRYVSFGKIYPRKDISIFFHVAPEVKGAELTGHTVRDVNKKSVSEIAQSMRPIIKQIKAGNDVEYKKVKDTLKFVPGILMRPMLLALEFILYDLNIWSKVLGPPKDSFGSMMITNVGPLGMQTGFAPLVSYSRCGLLLALGKVYDKAVFDENKKCIPQKTIDFCWTLDHRLIDGALGAKMGLYLEELLQNPELL